MYNFFPLSDKIIQKKFRNSKFSADLVFQEVEMKTKQEKTEGKEQEGKEKEGKEQEGKGGEGEGGKKREAERMDGETRFALAMGLVMVFRNLMGLPGWKDAINSEFEKTLSEYEEGCTC
jgi:hypothetical protein